MFTTFADDGADGLWRRLHAAVSDVAGTQSNPSRGGSRELLHVAFSISDPRRRWVLSRTPSMNPAFALAEVVWIMRGRQDAAFLVPWNSALPTFSGMSESLHGAYGHRLRKSFGVDQLKRAADALAARPGSRQVVLQVWDAVRDLPAHDGEPADADVPCNVGSQLKIADGRLDWLQLVRSNDLMRGLPYNLVQWTTIHEILAGWLDLPLGEYHQVSDSLHLYDQDRAEFGCGSAVEAPAAAGSFATGYDASAAIFASIEALVLRLNALRDLPRDPLDLIEDDVPDPYRDWQWVLIAEKLRRRHRAADSGDVSDLVLDPQLRVAFERWAGRFQER